MLGNSLPTLPWNRAHSSASCVVIVGLVSLSPYPCFTPILSRSQTASTSSLDTGAAAALIQRMDERSYRDTIGSLLSARTIGGGT